MSPLFTLVVVLSVCPPASALEAGGFLKGAFFYVDNPSQFEPFVEDRVAVGALRARMDVKEDIGPVRLEVSPEARLTFSSAEESARVFVGFGGELDRGLMDLSWEFLDDGRRRGILALDRLWLSVSPGDFQFSAGRQPIGFGASLFWAPTDLVTPFSPAELDREVRPGTDALRLIWSPGRFAEVGGLWAPGRDFARDTLLAHARFPLGPAEATLIGGLVRDRIVAGGSLTGEARGAGLRLEGIALERRREESGNTRKRLVAEVTGGFDYRFAGGWYLAAEYLYNGAGTGREEEYLALLIQEPYTLGLVPFLGRHYLLSRISKQLHPLVTGSAAAYWNVSDSSLLLWPEVSVSLADNLQGTVFFFIPAGSDTSEFGSTPVVAGAHLTFSF